jgi:hypothetical protein
MPKKIKIFIRIIGLCILILIVFIIYSLYFQQYILVHSTSPNKNIEIIVKYKDAVLMGPQDINIYYKKSNQLFEHHLISTDLFNNGGKPKKSNCIVKWNENCAKIIIVGSDQPEEIFEIQFDECVKVNKLKEKY